MTICSFLGTKAVKALVDKLAFPRFALSSDLLPEALHPSWRIESYLCRPVSCKSTIRPQTANHNFSVASRTLWIERFVCQCLCSLKTSDCLFELTVVLRLAMVNVEPSSGIWIEMLACHETDMIQQTAQRKNRREERHGCTTMSSLWKISVSPQSLVMSSSWMQRGHFFSHQGMITDFLVDE
jgi:hypothetical protein